MHLPNQAVPVMRGFSGVPVTKGVDASSLCSICKDGVEYLVKKAGCSYIGLLEFETECNLALDVETEGLGTAICAAAGVAIRYACKESLSDPARYVANKACSLAC